MDTSDTPYMLINVVIFTNWQILCKSVLAMRSLSKPLVAINHQSIVKCNIPTKLLNTWYAYNSSLVGTVTTYGVHVKNTQYGPFHN